MLRSGFYDLMDRNFKRYSAVSRSYLLDSKGVCRVHFRSNFLPNFKRHGVKNSVSIVAKVKPPAIEAASCLHHCDEGASYEMCLFTISIVSPNTNGSRPSTAVVAVSSIGLIRCTPDRIIASSTSIPSFRKC